MARGGRWAGWRVAALIGVIACSPAVAAEIAAGATVPALAVLDLEAQPVTLEAPGGRVAVYLFLSTRCPVSNAYNERIRDLNARYGPRGVRFAALYAASDEEPAEIADHAATHGFVFPVYKDPENRAADRFGVRVTPEAYVADASGKLVYGGRIDDAHNPARVKSRTLEQVLEAVLAGEAPPTRHERARGCALRRVIR
jgi:hypothetical protein